MTRQRRLTLSNRQRTRAVDLGFLRRTANTLLRDLLQSETFDLGIYVVGAPEMTHLNQTFLRHKGPTDVITFDYTEPASATERRAPALRGELTRSRSQQRAPSRRAGTLRSNASVPPQPASLCGEIFVCLDEALAQARRFRTTWQRELTRYIVHGILHLVGHEDRAPAARRKMKRAEDRLLRQLARQFDLTHLGRQ